MGFLLRRVMTFGIRFRSAFRRTGPAGLALSLFLVSCASNESSGGEWTVLFDGTGLEQWRGYNMDGIPEGWRIDGDELVFLHAERSGGNDLITREKFGDFELRLEYSISEGGNSGIFHHALEQPGYAIYWSAPEFQILDDASYPGNRPDQLSSSLYDLIAAEPQNTRPAGEWNSVRIISDGPRVEYWQNGERVVVFERWSAEWFELVRGTKFEPHAAFGTIPSGHIGLQDHGDEVRFRNIVIRKPGSP